MIFVGIDWAEAHHDVCLLDHEGEVLATRRIPEGLEGVARLHALLGEHAEAPTEVIVGIETDRGLLVGALVAAGYVVYAVNPLAASRYRDRHSTSRAKSDRADAKLLADLVRTDRHNHHTVATDSELLADIKVLARAHQNLVWTRGRQTNALRPARVLPRCARGLREARPSRCPGHPGHRTRSGTGTQAQRGPHRHRAAPGWPAAQPRSTGERDPDSLACATAGGPTTGGRGPGRQHSRARGGHHHAERADRSTRGRARRGLRSPPGRRDPAKSAWTRRYPRRPGARGVRGCPRPLRRC